MASLKLFRSFKTSINFANYVNRASTTRGYSSKADGGKPVVGSKEEPKKGGDGSSGCKKPEIVPICDPLGYGKAIRWDCKMKKVYFVDVPAGNVLTYDPKFGTCLKAKVCNEPLIFMFPVDGSDTKHIAGIGRKIAFVEWDGKCDKVSKVDVIQEVDCDPDFSKNMLNGTKVDPWGRLWTGTMGPMNLENGTFEGGKANLYSLTKGSLNKVKSKIGVSSGMAWNTEAMKMYWTDTLVGKVFEYDFDDGQICNEKVAFDFKANCLTGKPFGLTGDNKGFIWVCSFGEGIIVKFCPESGKVLKKFKIPTTQVTSVCFGGEKFDHMFVTTANISLGGKKVCGLAGATFMIKNPPGVGHVGHRYIAC